MSHEMNDEWYDRIKDLPEDEQPEAATIIEPPEDFSHEDYEQMLVDAEMERRAIERDKRDADR